MAKPQSFCKMVFLDDLTVKIMIPCEFVKNHPEMNMCPKIYLVGIEARTNSSWTVKVEKICDNLYMTDGWFEFVTSNGIRHSDFLVFRLIGESKFEVAVYGSNGCLKGPFSNSRRSRKDVGAGPSGLKGFSRIIEDHYKSYMHIPKAFAMETGIAGMTEITLRDSQGREWTVEIDSNRKELYNRICLSIGWNEFRKKNGIVLGTQCWFQFDPSSGHLIVTKEQPAGTSSPVNKAFLDSQQSSTSAMEQETRPSFFKVLLNDEFDDTLQLPLGFSNKYGKRLSTNTKLVTGSGETWIVKLEIADGKYCFTRGWTRFAKDCKLAFGEYLVFGSIVGEKSEFHVSVYGTCTCERKSPITKNLPTKDEPNDEVEPTYVHPEKPHFIVRLNTNHSSRLAIHKGFAEATGLMSENMVVLQYPPSLRCWPVLLNRPVSMDSPSNSHYFRLDLSWGWSEFRVQNRLVFGNTYSFEYIVEKNVIEVKLIKEDKN